MDAVEERHVESGLDVCYAKEQGEEKDKERERTERGKENAPFSWTRRGWIRVRESR